MIGVSANMVVHNKKKRDECVFFVGFNHGRKIKDKVTNVFFWDLAILRFGND